MMVQVVQSGAYSGGGGGHHLLDSGCSHPPLGGQMTAQKAVGREWTSHPPLLLHTLSILQTLHTLLPQPLTTYWVFVHSPGLRSVACRNNNRSAESLHPNSYTPFAPQH